MRNELLTFHGATGAVGLKLKAAHAAGLRVREITQGMNGYPEPFDNEWFIDGFENFAAAEKFAAENDGEVGSANWKNGWGAVENFAREFEPLTITRDYAKMLGDNSEITTARELRDRLAGELASIGADDDDEDKATQIDDLRDQMAKIANLPDATIIETDCGQYAQSFDHDEQMEISEDMKYISIGVRLTREEEEEEEEDD